MIGCKRVVNSRSLLQGHHYVRINITEIHSTNSVTKPQDSPTSKTFFSPHKMARKIAFKVTHKLLKLKTKSDHGAIYFYSSMIGSAMFYSVLNFQHDYYTLFHGYAVGLP